MVKFTIFLVIILSVKAYGEFRPMYIDNMGLNYTEPSGELWCSDFSMQTSTGELLQFKDVKGKMKRLPKSFEVDIKGQKLEIPFLDVLFKNADTFSIDTGKIDVKGNVLKSYIGRIFTSKKGREVVTESAKFHCEGDTGNPSEEGWKYYNACVDNGFTTLVAPKIKLPESSSVIIPSSLKNLRFKLERNQWDLRMRAIKGVIMPMVKAHGFAKFDTKKRLVTIRIDSVTVAALQVKGFVFDYIEKQAGKDPALTVERPFLYIDTTKVPKPIPKP